MLATPSRLLRSFWPELLWVAFLVANLAVMFTLTNWETIPYHNIWVSMALLYTFRLWPLPIMGAVLGLVLLVSGIALGYVVVYHHSAGWDEMAEVPMMAAMYVVIVSFALRRQEALAKLRESSARQRDFVRDASHHLRTPITIALGHAELMRSGIEGGEHAEDAAIVAEELAKVSVISDRLLLLASADDDHVLARDEIDASTLVHEAARRWTGAANREWKVVDGAHGTITGDEERLSLALDCLIENAVKVTDEGDSIAISSRAGADQLLLEVTDSGPGVPVEDRELIFNRFARGQRRPRSNGGAGLGLALVKAIVEAHGGRVAVGSAPEGGARFRIRLEGFEPYPHAVSEPVSTRPEFAEDVEVLQPRAG